MRVLPKAGLVWVTEPGREQIEVFALDNDKKLTRVRSFTVSGGPESLVVDEAAGRAYTNTWHGDTLAIDVAKESVVATWPNGCKSSRGLALDREAHLVYVGCAEGRVSALDAASGAVKGSVQAPVHDVDIIAFDEKLRHVYVPGDRKMAVVGAAKTGALSVLATVPTAPDAHCVVADGRGQAWVCAPEKGRVLVVKDSAPAM